MKARFFPALLLIAICLQASVFAQSATARWLLLKPSAQAMSMGGAGAGFAAGSASAYFNPAGLSFGSDLQVSASLVRPYPFFPDVRHLFIDGAARVTDEHSLSLAYNAYTHSIQAFTGDYYYTLEGGGYTQIRKMKLVK